MNQNNDQKSQQINIELGEKEAEGIYSNLAIITHSPAEFVIDFTRVVPGVPLTHYYHTAACKNAYARAQR